MKFLFSNNSSSHIDNQGQLMSNVINLLDRSDWEGDDAVLLPTSVRAVAVHFLSFGRNAWNATWITRYRPGDFLRDGRVVDAQVEVRRSPGTVFYLEVLPAIQINYGARKFLVAEINTNQPFSRLNLDQARYSLFLKGLTGFLRLIDPTSDVWLQGQRVENSVIVQEVEEDYIDIAAYNALASGRDAPTNPSIGKYKRSVSGSQWWWDATAAKVSLESYNSALEAVTEARERLAC